jgi:hypothetical protein
MVLPCDAGSTMSLYLLYDRQFEKLIITCPSKGNLKRKKKHCSNSQLYEKQQAAQVTAAGWLILSILILKQPRPSTTVRN